MDKQDKKLTAVCKDVDRAAKRVSTKAWSPSWKGDKNSTMRMMFLQDAVDMLRVRDAVAGGSLKLAARLASSMDTAAREELPNSLFELFSSHGKW